MDPQDTDDPNRRTHPKLIGSVMPSDMWFQGSSPVCPLHTTITPVIEVLNWGAHV